MVQSGSYLQTQEQSWESYESLHKFARSIRRDGVPCNEFLLNGLSLASTDADHEVEIDGALIIADKGKVELTLVAACDADTEANRGMRIDVKYKNAAGNKKKCYCTLGANATTETEFVDLQTGLVPVVDFYCFDQDDGPIATAVTYGSCIYAAVALGAATNLCIGITGLVAGIADPEICFAHINTTKQYPLLADVYGVGQIWLEREDNDTGDDNLVTTMTYLAPWGELITATSTGTTTHTDIIRWIKADGTYVGDFYRKRTIKTTQVVVKYFAVCDHDGATHYGVIETGNWESIHSAFFSQGTGHRAFIGKIEFDKSDATTVINILMTCQYLGDAASHTEAFQFTANQAAFEINREIKPASEVTFLFGDDNTAHPTCNMNIAMVEV